MRACDGNCITESFRGQQSHDTAPGWREGRPVSQMDLRQVPDDLEVANMVADPEKRLTLQYFFMTSDPGVGRASNCTITISVQECNRITI